MSKQRWIITVLLVATLGFISTRQVAAHGYIVRAIPENRAVLDRAPTRLQYWFSEALEPGFSLLRVRDQNGAVIAEGGVSDTDDTLMTIRLPNDLADGAYVVELRPAFASDGHVIAESRVFFVGEEVGGIAGQIASDTAIPLEIAWKTVHLAASMLLFGAFTLYALALVPAWGNSTYRAGLLPPRILQRLNVIIGFALLAAFAANGLALIQQTMVFFNISFTQALDANFIELVRIGSRFGDIWNWRVFFLGIVGIMFLASLYLKDEQPETVRPFLTASAWVMALVLGTSSVLSHAAGSLLWPWVGIGVDWLHVLAVGFWAGGLAALVLILPPALAPYTGDSRRKALLAVLWRFSPIAAGAVFIVITTGMYSASNWVYGPDEISSNFGISLLVKVALVLLLVAVGALHHIALRPQRYMRFTGMIQRVRDFGFSLRLEAALVLLVLMAAGWLSATPVPVPEFAQQELEAPTEVLNVGELTVVLSLLPGGPGINTYDTTITRDGQRVIGLDITLQQVHPTRDQRGRVHTLEAVEDGLYVTAGDDITRAGRWWTLMDITDDDGTTQRLAFEWQISDEAGVVDRVDPVLTNIITLGLVLLASGAALYPLLMRLTRRLNFDPLTVTISLSAIVVTAVVLVIGFVLIQETRDDYDATLNPTPDVINPVLPSQASLDRGANFYATYCIGWENNDVESVRRDLAALKERLPRTQDQELYTAVRDGWRDLPPCAPPAGVEPLTSFQQWDIVNYLRTFTASSEL